MGKKLTIGRVLVQHEWPTSLDLSLNDSVPQLLRFDGLPGSALLFVLLEELFKLLTPVFMQARSLVRAEERPVTVSFYSLHAEGGSDEGSPLKCIDLQ